MDNLSKVTKITRITVDGTSFTGSAATTDLTSEAVDMSGFEAAQFIVGFGAITTGAVTSTKVQQCDTSGGSYADLAGTAQTVADDDDNQIFVSDIIHPTERYLKHVVDRGTQNAVVDFLIVIQYGASKVPVTQPSTTTAETHVSPAEGTA